MISACKGTNFLIYIIMYSRFYKQAAKDLSSKAAIFYFSIFIFHHATHDVAPKAVSTAEAIDAINCTMNFIVSFLLIV